ncbi:substrate-binding periplasmic protein [Paucibacter sp. Y2R2-4]|uniref:substrate-binding periplasmic protein n=1 Tax=Paucibacter sp. Y2R2-4 TaxID=2893553 RepID=UPI0021E510BB|nr:hypothetical protein [Paucibacter sp. Y2R2-4]MCV2350682.1 hypothetical protein [Paucibacter sp. Y2R2-4]
MAPVPIPPYLTLDEKQPGVAERLLLDAAKQVGLTMAFEVYPAKRCRLRLAQGQSDALPLAATESNLPDFQFPMRGEAVDTSRRIASAQLVWVKRKDSMFDWDGHRVQGLDPSALLVGTRASVRIATDTLKPLGLRVDDSAFDVAQLLRKLLAQRIDVAVMLREEAQAQLPDPGRQALQIVPIPLLNSDFYLGIRSGLPAERQAQAEAWWDAIGKLRDKPEYRPR